jgi:erythrin-vacuolar iron transport family protein
LGGILHTVPFLIPYYLPALAVALAVVVVELFALALLRHRFFDVSFAWSLATVTLGGVLISGVSIGLGALLGTSIGA